MPHFPTVLVTGSAGLVGSEAVAFYSRQGSRVVGVDNNLRRDFFGPDGDTGWNLARLRAECPAYRHESLDVRARDALARLVESARPDLVIHCAAQPSHDLARDRPVEDFEINAVGTLNVLEACRRFAPDAPLCFLSTNKVYGDAPNEAPLVEMPTRWDYARPEDVEGITEACRIDRSTHSLFGASKTAADVLAQEYGRAYGLPVGVFRGGCLTGPCHAGAEQHGFLNYLVRACVEERPYRVYGYRGKQVRDNLHAADVIAALNLFAQAPRPGEVYNLGGGRGNSISLMEARALVESLTGRTMRAEYVDQPRVGDHICYISDTRKLRTHYPAWTVTRSIDDMLAEMVTAAQTRLATSR
ncbi:MAG: NAD-dependent epimerase/dehydratase family protein [Planctomycetes bacterium]|nr:NAD-dependent epimerase/dehydratase family protein [Planctomycetota bacterium]